MLENWPKNSHKFMEVEGERSRTNINPFTLCVCARVCVFQIFWFIGQACGFNFAKLPNVANIHQIDTKNDKFQKNYKKWNDSH
jgi:hypothetical protein